MPVLICCQIMNCTVMLGQSVNLLRLSSMEDRLSRGGDTTFVVNFWATWCAPCVKELPVFQDFHNKHAASQVKVLLISLDAKSSLDTKVRPFVSRSGLGIEFFLLDESNQQQYIDRISSSWSGVLPATLMVNSRRGKKKLIEGEINMSKLEEALQDMRE